VTKLKAWLVDAYTNLAMVNYPYPTNFLADLPGNPVSEFCRQLEPPYKSPEDLLIGLYRGINLYVNYTGKTKCVNFDEGSDGLGLDGWNYQVGPCPWKETRNGPFGEGSGT